MNISTQHIRKALWLGSLLMCLSFILSGTNESYAEGTKQLMPSVNNPLNIEIINPTLTKFASYQASPDEGLYITIVDPDRERIHFGWGLIFSDNFLDSTNRIVYFRIRDPRGNIVYGPALVPKSGNAYIENYEQAVIGPRQIAGNTGGYDAFTFQPTMAGDYSIEYNPDNPNTPPPPNVFDRNFAFRYFDITVEREGRARDGRVWSKNWDLSANKFEEPVFTRFYIYSTDSITTLFDMNGCTPFGFTIVCNRTGLTNTGNLDFDRRSRDYKFFYPEYKIFLNNPDPLAFPDGIPANLLVQPRLSGCVDGTYCIALVPDKLCYADMYIELNGSAGYQPNSRDVRYNRFLLSGPNCVPWDGRDGLGDLVPIGTRINIFVDIISGLTNFPIFDAEKNPTGFIASGVRPTGLPVKMYHDDSNIPYGTSELLGCVTNCHQWTGSPDDFEGPDFGFGNIRTLNTWWSGFTRPFAFNGITTPCDGGLIGRPPSARLDSFTILNTTRQLIINPHLNNNYPNPIDFPSITILKNPTRGAVVIDRRDGTFIYSPTPGQQQFRDTIMYFICDLNDPPLCVTDTIIIRAFPTINIVDCNIPDVFTPNNDELNEEFIVCNGLEGIDIDFKVYNRWGSLVYEDKNYKNDWRGQVNRGLRDGVSQVPDGTYFIVVKLIQTGETKLKYITVKR